MKKISILGSTGSIGLQALDIIRQNRGLFQVAALSCNSNIDLLEKQMKEFDVKNVAVFDEEKAKELSKRYSLDANWGLDGQVELAGDIDCDILLNALVGNIGIMPTVAAIQSGKDIALANKETLVSAGELIMNMAKLNGVKILPVDSEHSAIFQCLQGEKNETVKKIILSCSGGAFRNLNKEKLYSVKASDALQHPNWSMGKKITIDSATLMNKGFEIIEARMLFDVDYENIEVVIHPESIIHSMVEFIDGSIMAQLSNPDMRLPIQYSFFYPDRQSSDVKSLNFFDLKKLTFDRPDNERFPCLELAVESGMVGGTMPCVLNAANDVANHAFLEGMISFMEIPVYIEKYLSSHISILSPSVEEILSVDYEIKRKLMSELGIKKFQGVECEIAQLC
jgi:1-deoxy-D-xylulose-5-phosphate reductoisomerase